MARYDCYSHNGLNCEYYDKMTETYPAIDRFTNDLNEQLKNDETVQALVSVTLLKRDGTLVDHPTSVVHYQTLELGYGEKDIDQRTVEVDTVVTHLPRGLGVNLYNRLAEHSALWITEIPEEPEYELSFGVGSPNNQIHLNPVLERT